MYVLYDSVFLLLIIMKSASNNTEVNIVFSRQEKLYSFKQRYNPPPKDGILMHFALSFKNLLRDFHLIKHMHLKKKMFRAF